MILDPSWKIGINQGVKRHSTRSCFAVRCFKHNLSLNLRTMHITLSTFIATALCACVHLPSLASSCGAGEMKCSGDKIATCVHGSFIKQACGAGTVCTEVEPNHVVCGYPKSGGGSSGGGGGSKVTGKPSGGGGSGGKPKPKPNTPKPSRKTTPRPSGGGGSSGGGSSGDALVTQKEFEDAVTSCGYPKPPAEKYHNAVGQAKSAGDISTKREFAMFLTEILWESGGLRYTSEIRCESNNCPGDYRVPGCDKPGKWYFGRGYIQLTWCYNYKAASQALFGDMRLVEDPEKVASDDSLSWATAFWFWKANVHNANGVQEGRFGAATNAINGGLECRGAHQDKARKRWQCYQKVYKTLGLPGSPIEGGCYN